MGWNTHTRKSNWLQDIKTPDDVRINGCGDSGSLDDMQPPMFEQYHYVCSNTHQQAILTRRTDQTYVCTNPLIRFGIFASNPTTSKAPASLGSAIVKSSAVILTVISLDLIPISLR